MNQLLKYIPSLQWLRPYDRKNLSGDLTAGLTVGVMLIPQGMAYSMLAGLPPIYGLYASTIPLIIYAIFGTSRQLAVGPVAMVALLIASGVGNLAETGSDLFIQYAILLALMVGIIQAAMGIFRLGFLVNFLSHPVIAGFTSAAALIIGFSQIKHLMGLSIPRGKVHETILAVIEQWDSVHYQTLIIGLVSIAILIAVKKINKRIPGPLIVVLVGMGLVYGLGWYDTGVNVVKDVPGGLPAFGMPILEWSAIQSLFPIALTISFVGFMESIAVAKAIQQKHKDYQVVPNQELIGLGLSNVLGSLFSAFPVTGGFSRTAVNDQAGAKTGLASIISAVLIIVTLLFLTPYFYYLPHAVLASIILVAVFGLIDYKEALHLWQNDKRDFWVFMTTALATLILGIEEGILIGVILSLALLVFQVSYPHMAELGRVPGSREFRNLERFPNLETYSDILIIRFDAQLYFANAQSLFDRIDKARAARPEIRHVILEANAIHHLDSSAMHMLSDLVEHLHNSGCELYLSNVKGPVRDLLKKYGILNQSNLEHYYLSTHDAVADLTNGKGNHFTEYVFQTEK